MFPCMELLSRCLSLPVLGSTFGRNITPFFPKALLTLASFSLASGQILPGSPLRQSLCAAPHTFRELFWSLSKALMVQPIFSAYRSQTRAWTSVCRVSTNSNTGVGHPQQAGRQHKLEKAKDQRSHPGWLSLGHPMSSQRSWELIESISVLLSPSVLYRHYHACELKCRSSRFAEKPETLHF